VKSFWRWTGTIFFALAFIFLVLTGIGTSLPIDHHASCSASFDGAQNNLFAEIADDTSSIRWRTDISRAVIVSGGGPTAVWRETDSHGNTLVYRTTGYVYGQKLARTIDYVPGMPFAGTWTYSFSSAAAGKTLVSITEDGKIYNPFFRFLSRYVFGYDQRMQTYLTDLSTDLQEKVPISCEPSS
jgi:hypothetical protein